MQARDDIILQKGNLNKAEFGYDFKKHVLRHYELHLKQLQLCQIEADPDCMNKKWMKMCLE